jgi:quinone-reactive Ni/Fe-hydrogenase small subunit
MGPFESPLSDKPFSSIDADATADKVGVAILTVAAVGVAAHAAISAFKKAE